MKTIYAVRLLIVLEIVLFEKSLVLMFTKKLLQQLMIRIIKQIQPSQFEIIMLKSHNSN